MTVLNRAHEYAIIMLMKATDIDRTALKIIELFARQGEGARPFERYNRLVAPLEVFCEVAVSDFDKRMAIALRSALETLLGMAVYREIHPDADAVAATLGLPQWKPPTFRKQKRRPTLR